MKGIIFDLDGTLLDTIGDIAAAMNKALQIHNLPTHTIKEYENYIGNGAKILAERASGGIKTEEVFTDYIKIYSNANDIKTKPFPGIEKCLSILSETHFLAVLSNKPHNDTKNIVKKYFPDIHFSAVCGQRPEIPTKPDPAAAAEILHIINIPISDFIFVGDSPEDIMTGKALGMKTAGVNWGYRSEIQLKNAGADIIIKTTEELIQL